MDPDTHHNLVTRLVNKIINNADMMIRTEEYYLEDAEIIIISYGCTARSARRAVQISREKGIPVGMLRLISIWPFANKLIQTLADKVDKFIVAEMNLGQIRMEVERIVRKPVKGVHHAGGRMIAPQAIVDAITEIL
jgi:2-oxoglutarate ferredoxin oxidoreductase subunit alpha